MPAVDIEIDRAAEQRLTAFLGLIGGVLQYPQRRDNFARYALGLIGNERKTIEAIASGRGAVVNVASLAGKVPTAGSTVYSATKFGLRGFSMALADELRGTDVTVSCVSPGPVDTQFIMAELDTVTDLTMSQPLVTADEVAELVVASAIDGKLERATPRLSGALATAGYLAPSLRHALRPMLERRGRRNKQKLRERRAG